jgi:hypothetical protein
MAMRKLPGVYIEELPAFPNSAIAVETAIPAFVGYTFKAESNGKSLIGVPTKINSFAEYVAHFGGAFSPNFKIEADETSPDTFKVSYEEDIELYFYNSIRLFYTNGGSCCVILAVDVYGDKVNGLEVKASDFNKVDGALEILKNTHEPTLVVMPDVIKLKEAAYAIYTDVLAHCAGMQNRFAIFDLKNHDDSLKPSAVVEEFRSKIGNSFP